VATLDLRPLSLGEILDRSFALYRQHFLLFVGIAAIPQILVLAFTLAMLGTFVPFFAAVAAARGGAAPELPPMAALGPILGIGFVAFIVLVVIGLLAQGATVSAVADFYLGRTTTIRDSFRKARGKVLTLFGVGILSGLAAAVGFILLIFPGFYIICRLLAAVPVAIVENQGSSAALQRSFALSKGKAGRAFLILLLYVMILYAAILLFTMPLNILAAVAGRNTSMALFSLALSQIGSSVASVVVTPILMICVSVFYFDLRVRREAFDLQMMLHAAAAPAAGGTADVLS